MNRTVLVLLLVATIVTAVPILRDAPPVQIAGLGALVAVTAGVGWALRFVTLTAGQARGLCATGVAVNVAGGIALHALFSGWTLLVVVNDVIFLCQLYAGARREPISFAAFALFLPRTLAGPVIGYRSFARRLQAARWDADRAEIGAIRLALGLAKWLILGRALGLSIAPVFAPANAGATVGGTDAWLATIANYLQLYFELSVACDVAVGLLLLCGLPVSPAFFAPLRASSLASFWRRYHRGLVAFARVYLQRTFRVPGVPPAATGIAAFLCAGLWLAPGFTGLLWGALQAGALIVDRQARRALRTPRWLGWLATQLFMMVTALLLHVGSLAAMGRFVEGLIGRAGFALPRAATNFFSADWQKHLVFTDQPLIANHTIGLIVLLQGLVIAAIAVALPSTRRWQRFSFAVAIYFVLGLVWQMPAVPTAFAGLRL